VSPTTKVPVLPVLKFCRSKYKIGDVDPQYSQSPGAGVISVLGRIPISDLITWLGPYVAFNELRRRRVSSPIAS